MRSIETHLHQILSRAYIVGGSPCSGKSTLAQRVSAQFDLPYYKVDDHESAHMERSSPDRHPVMHGYATMSWDEIWSRPVAVQVAEEFAFYGERFEMILEDLQAFDPTVPPILEGAALLPELISRYPVDRQRVVYLIPTEPFQRFHYGQRPWIDAILNQCRDPRQAFDHWMQRDHLFGQEVLRQAASHRYKTIRVDGVRSVDDLFEEVSTYFGL